MFIRAYLRASTKEQYASRAKDALIEFAQRYDKKIAAFYVENESGSSIERPELNRLLDDAQSGDILLIEQVDRLSRLKDRDWKALKANIENTGLKVVSLDLPTSHQAMEGSRLDEFTGAMLKAINGMMLDMLAAIARKDYEDRRRRQAEGIKRNKDKFKGRPADTKRHQQVLSLRDKGCSLTEIGSLTGYSRASVARILKQHRGIAVS